MIEIIGGQDLKYMTEGSAGMDLVARRATEYEHEVWLLEYEATQ